MSSTTKNNYLDSKVMTASQPRLHLMLLENAVRSGNLARQAWDEKDRYSDVELALSKMIEIAEELTRAVSSGTTDISKQLEDQYAAIFRQLVSCQMNHDCDRLDACLELLEFHRETWRLLCDKLEATGEKPHAGVPVPRGISNSSTIPEGFSCEA